MKILTLLGSPKISGNTATVLSMFEENVKTEHEVERIHITQHKVGGCLGCMKCQAKKDAPGCVQKDDALTIFDKMIHADAIVYASPLYCWSFSSQIKPLIDRHVCLVSGYGTP
ncbi:MAG: NADPH-dependent FMN reductase, partial [Desulfobacteraceae bacterium 4572_87]